MNWEITNKLKIGNGKVKVDEIVRILLTNRGIITAQEVKSFLNPRLEDVTSETVGINKIELRKTLDRIKRAIEQKEQIIVFGDYDVDGITGAAVLWETLFELGAHVTPYIPNRIEEGYGLSIAGITNVTSQTKNVKLIITVDNGIVANEAVDFANKEKIDVIITDHHVSASDEKSSLPKAFAIVHTTKLCGAGVAYLLSKSLKKIYGKDTASDDHLELVTLATVADLVPLKGANRTLVKHGLPKLSATKRKGLRALFQEAGCDASSLGVYQIGHIIGPRLNAAGRLDSAMDSLRLICTKDDKRAHELAQKLGQTNRVRQAVMIEATEHASLSVKARKELKKLLIVSDETYPEGVIGLVAGRLVEEYYRPSIVISKGKKLSKGSVRSVNGFNIIEFLRSSKDFFVNVGGHPMAAGFTIETDRIEEFQKAFEKLADSILEDHILTRSLRVDCELDLSMVKEEFYNSIKDLAPFGMGNPEPTFVSRGLSIEEMRVVGREGSHVKLRVSNGKREIYDAIGFGLAEKASKLRIGNKIDLVYTIAQDVWNQTKRLQLKLKDFK